VHEPEDDEMKSELIRLNYLIGIYTFCNIELYFSKKNLMTQIDTKKSAGFEQCLKQCFANGIEAEGQKYGWIT
jgi:hypothetical protein